MSSANEYPIFIKGVDGWRVETVSLKDKKMTNKDEIAAQELIIANAQAEIKGLKSQQGKRFKPEFDEEYWHVDETGVAIDTGVPSDSPYDRLCYDNFNCYETKALADKASIMMKRSNAIIMACLMVDPDFVPNYLSGNQEHYSFGYKNPSLGGSGEWIVKTGYCVNRGPCVSTQEKWEEAAALLKDWGIE
jgi:hypothetical protein